MSTDGQNNDGFDFKLDGNEDYAKHRRQKAIFDARDLTRNVILNSKQQYNRGEISAATLQTDVRSAVEMYITEVEQIAHDVNATQILSEAVIHKVWISPPSSLLEYFDQRRHTVLSDKPEPKKVATVKGIWGFLTAPEEFTAEWTIRVDHKHDGPKPVTERASTRMPIEASIDAFRFVNRFLNDVNLDLEARLEDYMGDQGPGI